MNPTQPTPLPEIRDIAPPFAIPFLPLWAIIVLTILGTLLVAGLIWWIARKRRKASSPPLPPRQSALNALAAIQSNIELDPPAEFTIQVASILRRYVVGQFGIPATRQTSQEFLQSLANSSTFSETDQALLTSFLDKSDLIAFAKFQATSEDNRDLWEKAERFVRGGDQL